MSAARSPASLGPVVVVAWNRGPPLEGGVGVCEVTLITISPSETEDRRSTAVRARPPNPAPPCVGESAGISDGAGSAAAIEGPADSRVTIQVSSVHLRGCGILRQEKPSSGLLGSSVRRGDQVKPGIHRNQGDIPRIIPCERRAQPAQHDPTDHATKTHSPSSRGPRPPLVGVEPHQRRTEGPDLERMFLSRDAFALLTGSDSDKIGAYGIRQTLKRQYPVRDSRFFHPCHIE